ncbi:YiaA/YiaB family inner membrane protein [Neobacillus mesonae]|uniref:YiaA/YiaB family inner membrane protein n=1 Tax=Neobacillus mesonae TaxID=1193713 RepID=UPI00082F9491|nr:YiaA/YiaB family inner membrane protein [Neobacillus mesonae]MED4205722.1 YiaA/YiaB family inner membrane protein [Neobacillus mesonae]
MKHKRRNTIAFTFLAYFTLFAGVLLFAIGLYNANLELNEKGYYIAVMLLVIVGSILTQKVVRDNAEDDEIIAEQQRKMERNEQL